MKNRTPGLASKTCVPCRGGIPALNAGEIDQFLSQVAGWNVRSENGVARLERKFSYKDFAEAMVFVNRVAALAEREGHHPDLHIHYNEVRIEVWTHKIGGLHENDFILAAKIAAL